MAGTADIVDSIDRRLEALSNEIERLSAARAALDGRAADSEQAPERPAPASRRRRQTRRRQRRVSSGSEVVPAGRLELLLSEHGDLTTSALADRANGERSQVLTLLRELEAAGTIRRIGQRRSTRWHAITDEERIEQRAAELAARSRTAR